MLQSLSALRLGLMLCGRISARSILADATDNALGGGGMDRTLRVWLVPSYHHGVFWRVLACSGEIR